MKENIIKNVIFSLILVFIALLSVPSKSFAATLSISPNSGTYSDDFTVYLQVSAGTDGVVGADLVINYTGPIEYSSITQGDASCSPQAIEGTNSVNVICLITPGAELTGTGSVAGLTFSPTGTGSATILYGATDLGDVSVTSATGGSYTIGSSSAGDGNSNDDGDDTNDTNDTNDTSNNTGNNLPETAEINPIYTLIFALGIFSIIYAGIIYYKSRR